MIKYFSSASWCFKKLQLSLKKPISHVKATLGPRTILPNKLGTFWSIETHRSEIISTRGAPEHAETNVRIFMLVLFGKGWTWGNPWGNSWELQRPILPEAELALWSLWWFLPSCVFALQAVLAEVGQCVRTRTKKLEYWMVWLQSKSSEQIRRSLRCFWIFLKVRKGLKRFLWGSCHKLFCV